MKALCVFLGLLALLLVGCSAAIDEPAGQWFDNPLTHEAMLQWRTEDGTSALLAVGGHFVWDGAIVGNYPVAPCSVELRAKPGDGWRLVGWRAHFWSDALPPSPRLVHVLMWRVRFLRLEVAEQCVGWLELGDIPKGARVQLSAAVLYDHSGDGKPPSAEALEAEAVKRMSLQFHYAKEVKDEGT